MTTRQYTSFTIQQKKEIVEEYEKRYDGKSEKTKSIIAEWAKKKYSLKCAPHSRTIRRILNNKDNYKYLELSSKRNRKVKNELVEEELAKWVWDMYEKQMFINDNLLKEKAKKISAETEDASGVKYTNGWLWGFKQRLGFRCFKSHGESGQIDEAKLEEHIQNIREKLSKYSLNDCFNADEFGLNYNMAPTSTIGPGRIPGRKKKKERETVLGCCNGDGTEKIHLWFVGKSAQPRCFKGKQIEGAPFVYRSNAKAWMTTEIFWDWLLQFDNYIGRFQNRRVALLLDNASCHGTIATLPFLRNVEVIFLPANTTSRLQPMDAGIIASIKQRYKRKQASVALVLEEEDDTFDVYRVNLWTAMNWLSNIWDIVSNSTMYNCWYSTRVFP